MTIVIGHAAGITTSDITTDRIAIIGGTVTTDLITIQDATTKGTIIDGTTALTATEIDLS